MLRPHRPQPLSWPNRTSIAANWSLPMIPISITWGSYRRTTMTTRTWILRCMSKRNRRNRRNTDHHRTCGVGRTRNGTTMATMFLLFLLLRKIIRQTKTRPWRNDFWRVARVVGNGRCNHRHHNPVAISSCPRTCTTMVEVSNRHNDDRAVVNPAKSSRPGRGW
jgi:hypothetical protein